MLEVLTKVAEDVPRDYYCQISHQDSESQPFGLLQERAQAAYERYRQGECADPPPASKPLWQRVGDLLAEYGDKAVEVKEGIEDAFEVRHLKFTKLADGHISVRAETPPGTRIQYRRTVAEIMNSDPDKFFGGTFYNKRTVAVRTGGGLLRRAVSKGSLLLAGVTSLASNLRTFGMYSEGATFWDRREFWVSTGVDFVVSVAVGVAAAAVVAGAIALAAVIAGVTAPLWLAIAVTTGLVSFWDSE